MDPGRGLYVSHDRLKAKSSEVSGRAAGKTLRVVNRKGLLQAIV